MDGSRQGGDRNSAPRPEASQRENRQQSGRRIVDRERKRATSRSQGNAVPTRSKSRPTRNGSAPNSSAATSAHLPHCNNNETASEGEIRNSPFQDSTAQGDERCHRDAGQAKATRQPLTRWKQRGKGKGYAPARASAAPAVQTAACGASAAPPPRATAANAENTHRSDMAGSREIESRYEGSRAAFNATLRRPGARQRT